MADEEQKKKLEEQIEATTGPIESGAVNLLENPNVDASTPVSPSPEVAPVEDKSSKPAKNETFDNVNFSNGFNLLPGKSSEEIKVEENVDRINFGSLTLFMGVMFLVITLLSANLILTQLRKNEEAAHNLVEQELLSRSLTINRNYEIVDRIDLYKSVTEESFNPKAVIDYWQNTISQYGEMKAIEISQNLVFKVEGTAVNMDDTAKLWHQLSVDERIDFINLQSVSYQAQGDEDEQLEPIVRFIFEGKLTPDNFELL